jgi:hypothetical protein
LLLWRCLFTHGASGRVVTKGRSHAQLIAGPSLPLSPVCISFAVRTHTRLTQQTRAATQHRVAEAQAAAGHRRGDNDSGVKRITDGDSDAAAKTKAHHKTQHEQRPNV